MSVASLFLTPHGSFFFLPVVHTHSRHLAKFPRAETKSLLLRTPVSFWFLRLPCLPQRCHNFISGAYGHLGW